MATFEIVEGRPGQGKSLYTARLARKLLDRNKKWYDKTGIKRRIMSNVRFSPEFEKEAKDFLGYWATIDEITKMSDVDLLWDEIATELDSRNFQNLSEEVKRFLSQYRKRGVDIYANTQDFSMVDMRARLMVTKVATLNKVIGSPDPSPTRPPIKTIWGLVMIRDVAEILTDDPHNKTYMGIPTFFFINEEDVKIYDTRQDIPMSPPLPYKHIVRQCEYADDPDHDCNVHKVLHV